MTRPTFWGALHLLVFTKHIISIHYEFQYLVAHLFMRLDYKGSEG